MARVEYARCSVCLCQIDWIVGTEKICGHCSRERHDTEMAAVRAAAIKSAQDICGADHVATRAIVEAAQTRTLREQVWGTCPQGNGEIAFWKRVKELVES